MAESGKTYAQLASEVAALTAVAESTREHYELWLDAFPLPAYEVSMDGHILRVNQSWIDVTGYSRQEVAEGFHASQLIAPDDMPRLTAVLAETSQTGRENYHPFITKDGVRITAHVFSAPIVECDEIVGSRGIFMDVTTHLKVEDERDRLKAHLLHSHKMEALGTLAGGIAHDMNNVLAVVLGIASVLKLEAAPNSVMGEDIELITSAALRGKSLVEGLLGFARRGKYEIRPVDLGETLRALVALLEHTFPKEIAIEVHIDDGLPHVECDASQISQTLMNLCVNSRDALKGGGTIVVSASETTLGEANPEGLDHGRYVHLEVRDDGTGMEERTRQRAFEPFFTTKDVGAGTGLGLAMAYGIVTNHGGTIRLESTPGKGTTVHIWLLACSRQATKQRLPASHWAPTQHRGRLLVIDDESLVRGTAERMLSASGYEVVLADGGAAALEIYRNRAQPFDLILLDLSMPVMGGLECFNKLLEIDPQVRVLICTGHGSSKDTNRMIELGALGVIRKPIALQELDSAVEAAIKGHQGKSAD